MDVFSFTVEVRPTDDGDSGDAPVKAEAMRDEALALAASLMADFAVEITVSELVTRQEGVTLRKVVSSNIDRVGYDEETREMHVVFQSSPDTLYVYLGVEPEMYSAVMANDSVGSAVSRLIKPTYDFRKEARDQ